MHTHQIFSDKMNKILIFVALCIGTVISEKVITAVNGFQLIVTVRFWLDRDTGLSCPFPTAQDPSLFVLYCNSDNSAQFSKDGWNVTQTSNGNYLAMAKGANFLGSIANKTTYSFVGDFQVSSGCLDSSQQNVTTLTQSSFTYGVGCLTSLTSLGANVMVSGTHSLDIYTDQHNIIAPNGPDFSIIPTWTESKHSNSSQDVWTQYRGIIIASAIIGFLLLCTPLIALIVLAKLRSKPRYQPINMS